MACDSWSAEFQGHTITIYAATEAAALQIDGQIVDTIAQHAHHARLNEPWATYHRGHDWTAWKMMYRQKPALKAKLPNPSTHKHLIHRQKQEQTYYAKVCFDPHLFKRVEPHLLIDNTEVSLIYKKVPWDTTNWRQWYEYPLL